MFMSAREIRGSYGPWRGDRYEVQTPDGRIRKERNSELWARKRQEASLGVEPTLDKQVLKDGVQNPVSLESPDKPSRRRPYVLGGHHRVAVMAEHKPDDLMPVEHFEHPVDAWLTERTRSSRGSR